MLWKEDIEFKSAFETALLKTDKDDWGQESFHISDASNCARKIGYRILIGNNHSSSTAWKGYVPNKTIEDEMTFFVGHAIHERLQDILVKRLKWCKQEDIEVKVSVPEINLRGSADAVVSTTSFGDTYKGSHILLDIKSKKDDVEVIRTPGKGKVTQHSFPDNIKKYPNEEYFIQVQTYMYLLPKLYPERYPEINTAVLLYVCKNNGLVYCTSCEYDPQYGESVIERVKYIKTFTDTGELPPREYSKSEGKCRGWLIDGKYQYGCPYYNICYSKNS